MTTRRVSWWLVVAAVSVASSGCVADATRISARALETAQRSRVAALTGPDRAYVRFLERSIADMKAQPTDVRDDVGLLLAVDELAEIYTLRLVHFDKAVQANADARELLNAVSNAPGGTGRLGWFVNRNRGIYSVIAPFRRRSPGDLAKLGPTDGSWLRQETPLGSFFWAGGGKEPLRSIYPESFVRAIVERDVARARARIGERHAILEKLRGVRRGEDDEGGGPGARAHHVDLDRELSVLEASLGSVAEPHRSALLLEKVWELRHDVGPPRALAKVAELGAAFLAAETEAYREAHTRDAVLVRLRVSVAHLGLGRVVTGVSLVEEAEALLKRQEHRLQSLQQEARWRTSESGVLGALFGALLLVPGGGNLSLGGQGILATLTAPARLTQIARVYEHRSGIAGVLTEAEQLDFYVRLGQAYEAVGEAAKAIVQYRKAIDIVERQRVTIRSEVGRISFVADKEAPYARLIPLLVRRGEAAAAFDVTERARSRAFVELLGGGAVRLAATDDRLRYETIVRQQMELDVLAQANNLPRPLAEQVYRAERGVDVSPPLAPISLEFESLATVHVARLDELAAVLGQEAALVAFFVGPDETSVLLVQDGTVSAWNRPLGRDALHRLVEQIRASIGKGVVAPPGLAAKAELDALTAHVYRTVLAPAFTRLTKRVVYIAPHGPLHYLPFAAISDGREHLIDRYTLLTTPSATVLTYLAKKPKTAPATTVVFANPDVGDPALDLPDADREGAMVQARRTDTILFRRSEATRRRLQEWAPKAGILHVAAHARLDVRRPLESAVLLAGEASLDGRLTAGEVFGLTLPSTLVVLSACETGLGSLASGDELIGLTRGVHVCRGSPHRGDPLAHR